MLTKDEIKNIILEDCKISSKKFVPYKRDKYEYICYETCMVKAKFKENPHIMSKLVELVLDELIEEGYFRLDEEKYIYSTLNPSECVDDEANFKLESNVII